MPRRKKKTLKQHREQLAAFHQAINDPSFDMFNGKHYFDVVTQRYYCQGRELVDFDQPTAELLKAAFLHWVKVYYGESFQAIKPE